MNRSRHFVSLSLLLLCTVAQAANWSSAGLHDLGVYYYDNASIEHQGDRRRAWTMLDYRDPQKNKQGQKTDGDKTDCPNNLTMNEATNGFHALDELF